MKRLVVLALAAIAAAGACSSGSKTSNDWDQRALTVADGLKVKLVTAKVACNGYLHWNYPLLTNDYQSKGLPLPAAVTACQGEGGEDLTTEVFADNAAKQKFIDKKTELLCRATAKKSFDFPGFPYVDGGAWIFEPDDMATATSVQKILGGTVKNAGCKKS